MFFLTFDCKKGYWQIQLAEKSRDLATSICSLGKFRYTRAPMGFISTGDSYNQRSDKALKGLGGITKIVDDILIASETIDQHIKDIHELLKRCKEKQITDDTTVYWPSQLQVDLLLFMTPIYSIQSFTL